MLRNKFARIALNVCGLLAIAISAHGAQVDFTGGTVTLDGGGTAVTDGTTSYNTYEYVENGFKMEAFGEPISVGPYYGNGNDVIHGHWETGFGALTMIKFSKVDGTAFDLNYFVLTSNTQTGGGAASGNEEVYIHASTDGVNSSYVQLLPPENWGFPAVNVFLGAQFDDIKAFWFTASNEVACFGMDNFYIDEAAPVANPSEVPEPGSMALLGGGGILLGLLRRKKRNA